MEQLPRIEARVANLHGLHDLIRALRALAASHLQEAQGALAGIRRYTEAIESAIVKAAALMPDSDEDNMPADAVNGDVLLVICSEHGFAGPFNDRLIAHAVQTRAPAQNLAVIGRHGASLAMERGVAIDQTFAMATHVGGVLGVSRRVAAYAAAAASATVIFGAYRRGGSFEVASRRLLPLDPALLAAPVGAAPPLHHLAPDLLLQRLADEYLLAEITRAVMESLASENAARLRAMEAADHNIKDKLDDLKRLANTLRQEAITTELLDVVTGSEAILNTVGGQR